MISREHNTDGTRQERKEGKSNEFYTHGEDILISSASSDVTVSYCRNSSKNEVESIHIDLPNVCILVNAWIACWLFHLFNEVVHPASFLRLVHTNFNPDDGHDMSEKNNTQLKFDEVNELTNFLSCVSKPVH